MMSNLTQHLVGIRATVRDLPAVGRCSPLVTISADTETPLDLLDLLLHVAGNIEQAEAELRLNSEYRMIWVSIDYPNWPYSVFIRELHRETYLDPEALDAWCGAVWPEVVAWAHRTAETRADSVLSRPDWTEEDD